MSVTKFRTSSADGPRAHPGPSEIARDWGRDPPWSAQRTQQRDGDAASDRATQRDVYVSDVLERPELPEPLQVTAVHESPAVTADTVVCTVCVCGSLLVSARYGSVGIGLLATTRAAKERSPVLAPGP